MSTDKTWDEDDPRQRAWISVRQRIFEYYLRKIRSGELHAGERLPTTREIAEQFGTVDIGCGHQFIRTVPIAPDYMSGDEILAGRRIK